MPITRDEFESGELSPYLLVIRFLRENPEYAYSAEEILKKLASRGTNLTAEDMQNTLIILEKREMIEATIRRGMVYYIYHKPRLGFRQG